MPSGNGLGEQVLTKENRYFIKSNINIIVNWNKNHETLYHNIVKNISKACTIFVSQDHYYKSHIVDRKS